MSDQEEKRQPQDAQDASKDASKASGRDLSSELFELGKQLETTIRGVLEDERTRTIQRDLSTGMGAFFTQMQQAAKAVQEDPRVKDMTERGQKTWTDMQQSPAARDFQSTVTHGMNYLNEQLQEFNQRMQQPSATPPPTSATPEGETPAPDPTSPATGPTVPLNPDAVADTATGVPNEPGQGDGPTTPPPGESQTASHAQQNFLEQMRLLGQQMEQTARTLIASERSHEVQQQIRTGMEAFFAQMQQAAKTVQEDPRVKDMAERGQQSLGDVQQNQAVRDLQQTLANGLAYFNEQFKELSARISNRSSDSASSKPTAQQVPIDIEEDTPGPATGPTTRLDPDVDVDRSTGPDDPNQPKN